MHQDSEIEGEILNDAAITQLQELGEGNDLLIEILQMFREETPKRLDAMADSVFSSFAHELARSAHSLKSSAGNIGAARLQTLCASIEAAARTGDLDGMASQVAIARREYQVALDALDAVVNQ